MEFTKSYEAGDGYDQLSQRSDLRDKNGTGYGDSVSEVFTVFSDRASYKSCDIVASCTGTTISTDPDDPLASSYRSILRHRDGGTSNFGTIMHIIKCNVGTGILAIPNAFSNAGVLVGTIGLALIGLMCTHCMHILVNCSHYLCRRSKTPFLSYADTVEMAFSLHSPRFSRHARKAKMVVLAFLLVSQFGFCCVYVLFISQNVQFVVMRLTNNTAPHCDINKPIPLWAYELSLMGLLILLSMVRNIKVLIPFSVVANIFEMLGLAIIMYYILIVDGLNGVSRLPLFRGWSKLPVYFGTAIFAFEGINAMLPLENKMREPKAFPSLFGVLNVGMVVTCALYLTIGFYGYVEFDSDSAASVTLNLSGWYGTTAQLLFTLSIFISYSLQLFVPMDIIGDSLDHTWLARTLGPNRFNYILRIVFVAATVGVTISVGSYLDLFISLIGSLLSAALAIIFPPILEVITFWPERDRKKYFCIVIAKNIVIIVIGLVGFVSGTVISINELRNRFASPDSSVQCPLT